MADITSVWTSDNAESYGDFDRGVILSGRRSHVPVVDCQARFLALAAHLGIPILSCFQSRFLTSGGASLGQGLSFSVSRPLPEIHLQPDDDKSWVNTVEAQRGKPWQDWFESLADCGIPVGMSLSDETSEIRQCATFTLVVKNHITKRIFGREAGTQKEDDDTHLLAAITNEMRVLCRAGVQSSVHIVSLIAVTWDVHPTVNNRFWPSLVLEGAEHGRIDQFLRSNPGASFVTKLSMLVGVVSAMSWLHECGVVHRDIKPANMLVCSRPSSEFLDDCLAALHVAPIRVKLCDFGCAAILDDYDDEHEFSYVTGTPGWMAPEVVRGSSLRPGMLLAADIFSLGLVAASIFLNGEAPFAVSAAGDVASMSATEYTHGNGKLEGTNLVSIENLLAEMKAMHVYDTEELDAIGILLGLTLQINPDDRASLPEIQTHLQWQVSTTVSKQPQVLEDFDNMSAWGISRFLSHLPTVTNTPLYLRTPRPYLGRSLDDVPFLGLPDVAFESDIRWSLLPRPARREIWHDIRVRAEGTGRSAGPCALSAASLIINGAETPDGASSRAYLEKAVQCGEPTALNVAMNIFNALDGSVSEDVRSRVLGHFRNPTFRATALIETKCQSYLGERFLPESTSSDEVKGSWDRERTIAWETFGREFPSEFQEFRGSDDYSRIISTIPPLQLKSLRRLGQCLSMHGSTWSSGQLTHNPFDRGQVLDIHDYSFFVAEVMELECVDEPDEEGFTLLQRAVFHGNQIVVELLLDTLGADVEACGVTPHWTPLWLACWLGYYELAVLLLSHGADIGCRDSVQGAGVLDFINQFHTEEQVEGIGYQALAHGLDINGHSGIGGVSSPLFTCSSSTDYSNGAAIRFLVENEAIADTRTLCIHAARLNLNTLGDLRAAPAWRDTTTKTSAISGLVQLTRFHHMFVSGSLYRENLKPTLCLLAESNISSELDIAKAKNEVGAPLTSQLSLALRNYRADVLEALLTRSTMREPLESILKEAIVLQYPAAVQLLIERGADVMALWPEKLQGLTDMRMFEYMTVTMPSLLPVAIKQLEARGDVDIKAVLSRRYSSWGTHSLLVTLLESGGWFGELDLAESLRVRFGLDFDDDEPDYDGNDKPTLTTALVQDMHSVDTGAARLIGLQYLLSMEPKPKFYIKSPRTLLHAAVVDPTNMHSEEKVSLLRLLVNAYPDETMAALLEDNVFHTAALWGNTDALEFLQDYAEISPAAGALSEPEKAELRCFSRPWRGATPLDYVHESLNEKGVRVQTQQDLLENGPFGKKWDLGLFDVTLLRERHLQCYRFLRTRGALHSDELEGYMIRGFLLPADAASHEDFAALLKRAASKYSLGGHVVTGPESSIYTLPPYLMHGTTDDIGLADAQDPKAMFAIVSPAYTDRVAARYEEEGVANSPNSLSTPIVVSFTPEPAVSQPYRLADGASKTSSEVQAIRARSNSAVLAELVRRALPEPPRDIANECCPLFRVCELVWRQSNFYIRGYVLCAGPWSDDTRASLDSWIEHRMDSRMLALVNSTREGEVIVPPFAKLDYARPYRHKGDNETKYLEWSRGGKIWSQEEVDKLADAVVGELQQELAPFVVSDQIPQELQDVILKQFG